MRIILLLLIPAAVFCAIGSIWCLYLVAAPVAVVDTCMESPNWVTEIASVGPWLALSSEDEDIRSRHPEATLVSRCSLDRGFHHYEFRMWREQPDSSPQVVWWSGFRSTIRLGRAVAASTALLIILGLLYMPYRSVIRSTFR